MDITLESPLETIVQLSRKIRVHNLADIDFTTFSLVQINRVLRKRITAINALPASRCILLQNGISCL